MRMKRYIVRSMSEALRTIKAELGENAFILTARPAPRAKGLGRFAPKRIEVTAAVNVPELEETHVSAEKTSEFEEALNSALSTAVGSESAPNESPPWESMMEEMRQLREELARLKAQAPEPQRLNRSALSPRGYEIYLELINNGVDPESAERIASEAAATEGESPREMEERLCAATARSFPSRDALGATGRMGRVIAFVGPTGSGKTTTAAKVAALARKRGFQRVALVTTDLERAGTVSYSRALGRAVGAHVGAARGRNGLAKALRHFGDSDLVLVDTAGESPFDDAHYDRLRDLLFQEERIGIHVVLPASADARCNRSALDRYTTLGPMGLVFTKMDENRVCGPLFSEAGRTGLPVSFVSGGPHVPEDLEVPTASRVRDMILRRVIWRSYECSLEESRSPYSRSQVQKTSGTSECA